MAKDISKASFKELGSITSKLISLISFGASIPITLLKFVLAVKSSVSAEIKFALALANEDSAWARSVNVISPFCNLAESDSTCLSKRLALSVLNLLFLILNNKSL